MMNAVGPLSSEMFSCVIATSFCAIMCHLCVRQGVGGGRIKGWLELGHCHLYRNHVSRHVDESIPFHHHEPSVADCRYFSTSLCTHRSRPST